MSIPPTQNSFWPLLEASSDAMALAVPDPWRLVVANSTLADWLEQSAGEVNGQPLDTIVAPLHAGWLLAELEALQCQKLDRATASGNLRISGLSVPVQLQLRRLDTDDDPLVGIVISRNLVVLQPVAEAAAARRDPLTGLADRSFVLTRLAELVASQRSADHQFAVLFIDLDNFKQVNDVHGHLVGDRVLQEVARRLARSVRTGDHVARFGGDEFVVLLERAAYRDEIQPVIDRIHAALETPIALPSGEAVLSVSIGVADAADHHRSPEDLLVEADRDMYAAKRLHI